MKTEALYFDISVIFNVVKLNQLACLQGITMTVFTEVGNSVTVGGTTPYTASWTL